MKFDTKQEAFNFYRSKSIEEMEKRAAEIRNIIDTDANADISALNVEIDGLNEAKANAEEKRSAAGKLDGFKTIETRSFAQAPKDYSDPAAAPEYRTAFFKGLMGRELSPEERAAVKAVNMEYRADNYSTTSEVAAVIPTAVLNEVITKARDEGGIMGVSRVFQVPANIKVPVATPAGAASWNTEGATVESGEPNVVPVEFGALEILKVFSISAAVKRMSVPAFESYITEELQASVMATIANSLVNGTGSGQGTGIASGISWYKTTTSSHKKNHQEAASTGVTFADIIATIALLKSGYARGAVWAMNPSTLYNRIYSVVDGNDRPIFTDDAAEGFAGKVLGYPVVLDDYIDDDTAYFGNFKYLGYNLAQGITIESSRESSFKSGRVDYRALAIADTKPLVPEAFAKLTVAASSSSSN